MNRDRVAWGLIGGLPLVYLAVRFGPAASYFVRGESFPQDFGAYWTAAQRLSEGSSIYRATDVLPFKYPLTFAYVFMNTFFTLELRWAVLIWQTLSIAVYFGSLMALVSALRRKFNPDFRLWTLAFASAILLSWKGILENLSFGQVDLLLAAGLFFVVRGIFRESGLRVRECLVVIAILTTKPHLAIAFFPWLPFLSMRLIGTVSFGVLGSYVAPALWLGFERWWQIWQEWYDCLRIQQDAAFVAGDYNQSLPAVLSRLVSHPEWVSGLSIGFGFLFLVTLVRLWTIERSRTRGQRVVAPVHWAYWCAFSIAGYLLFSPLSWRWFALYWPGVVLLLVFARQKWTIGIWLWAACALLIRTPPAIGSSYGFYCLGHLCLWGVAVARLWEGRRQL